MTWPRFACPACRCPLAERTAGPLTCASCGRAFERLSGIHRFLLAGAQRDDLPLLRQYRRVRERDGYRRRDREYYRRLPAVPRDDPRAAEWRIRRESYGNLQRQALPVWQGPSRVLDLGAGSGWLSHRLASFGHDVVAVDRLDDEEDGLGAYRHYEAGFVPVQADFDALPFEGAAFDVVVLNGSLHYSPDLRATLAEARRVLAPGGSLVVMDSPMFRRVRDGQAMVADQLRSFTVDYGVADAVQPGIGFLTFADLDRTAADLGLRSRFVPSRGPIGWRVRRQVGRLRLHRAPAAFGVWVAQ